jgi:predicted SprT family Zn-dependent metalloprotease
LLAAKADEKQAEAFLEHIGFTGLKFKSSLEDRINFGYKGVDMAILKKNFGPVVNNASGSVSGKFGKHGSIAFWPSKKLVVLRNSAKGGVEEKGPLPKSPPVEPPVRPTSPRPVKPAKPDPTKTGTENDDKDVPVTKISPRLEELYASAQKYERYRKTFLHEAWKELNITKFGGRLRMPYLQFMKMQGATSMRLRGVWSPRNRQLKISPRLFNASQNFFIETLLHEMCHQACYELSAMSPEEAADNRKHKGHGRVWSAWMRKVGLNPLRYDPNENSVYMTEEERTEHEQKMEKWKQTKKDAEEQGLWPARMQYGEQVVVRRAEGLEKGIIVCTTGKTTNRWAILPLKTVEAGVSPYSHFTWFINNPPTIAYHDPINKNWAGNENFERLARVIVEQYESKARRRETKKMMRRNFGFW